MHRTVLLGVCAAVLCLGLTATPAFARRVMHGAMDICQINDSSQSWIDGAGTEVCCARDDRGVFFCVECDPPGSNNCDMWYETDPLKAPHDRIVSILLTRALEVQGAVRQQLDSLPAKIKEQCPAPPTNK